MSTFFPDTAMYSVYRVYDAIYYMLFLLLFFCRSAPRALARKLFAFCCHAMDIFAYNYTPIIFTVIYKINTTLHCCAIIFALHEVLVYSRTAIEWPHHIVHLSLVRLLTNATDCSPSLCHHSGSVRSYVCRALLPLELSMQAGLESCALCSRDGTAARARRSSLPPSPLPARAAFRAQESYRYSTTQTSTEYVLYYMIEHKESLPRLSPCFLLQSRVCEMVLWSDRSMLS